MIPNAAVPTAANVTPAATPAVTPNPVDNNNTDAVQNVEDEQVPLGVNDEENQNDTNTVIEDEQTPLAANEEKQPEKHNFWWWILAVIAGITGKTAYDKKNKKGIFTEKESVDNRNDDTEK